MLVVISLFVNATVGVRDRGKELELNMSVFVVAVDVVVVVAGSVTIVEVEEDLREGFLTIVADLLTSKFEFVLEVAIAEETTECSFIVVEAFLSWKFSAGS